MSLKLEVLYKESPVFDMLVMEYSRYGVNHRINGPAIVWGDGDYHWFQYGTSTHYEYGDWAGIDNNAEI